MGICNGMQIIGMTHGCELKEVTEIGPTTITKLRDDPLVDSLKKLEVYELHNYCINLPDNFKLLAESDKCIQIIKHKEKSMYGTTFHPEVMNKELITAFSEL